MSWLSSPDAILSSGWLSSAYAGHGILGSTIPTTGDNGGSPVLNDSVTPSSEYRWALETAPVSGSLSLFEDLTFEYSNTTDGFYSFVYRLWQDGVSQGTATVSLQIGPSLVVVSATTGGASGSVSAHSTASCTINATTGQVVSSVASSSGVCNTLVAALTGSVIGSIGSTGYVNTGLTLTQADIDAIAAAVLAALNATTGTRTVGQHLQAQSAVLLGNETGAGTTHVTFTDGTAVVEADVPLPGAIGNRTNVTISV